MCVTAVALALSPPGNGRAITPDRAMGPAVDKPARQSMKVYFGTTHSHTGADNNHSPDDSHARDVFEAAKADGFHFLLLTEHSGPSGPDDPVAFYADARAQAASFTEDEVFVGLAGYEYTENEGSDDDDRGHMTVYGTDEFVSAMSPGWTFRALYEHLLAESTEHRVFAGFNHPGPRGHQASAPQYLDPGTRWLVPFTEGFNGYVTDEKPDTHLYRALLAHLDRGWRVAPTCGLDSHSLKRLTQDESAAERPCRTGLLAPSLTEDAVLRALMARRIYASADLNLRAKYTADRSWMGSVLSPHRKRLHFDIRLNDPDTQQPRDRITRVQVVGERGRILASRRFDAHRVRWRVTVRRGKDSYLLVRAFTSDPEQLTVILAPVWFWKRTPKT
jgi:hypothetical protein